MHPSIFRSTSLVLLPRVEVGVILVIPTSRGREFASRLDNVIACSVASPSIFVSRSRILSSISTNVVVVIRVAEEMSFPGEEIPLNLRVRYGQKCGVNRAEVLG